MCIYQSRQTLVPFSCLAQTCGVPILALVGLVVRRCTLWSVAPQTDQCPPLTTTAFESLLLGEVGTHVQGLTPFPCISERKRGLVPQKETLHRWSVDLLGQEIKVAFRDLRVVVDKFKIGLDVRVEWRTVIQNQLATTC